MTEISHLGDLRARYGEPREIALKKELSHIDRHSRNFIGHSPFVVVSTSDLDGCPDASPRGDAPGFVVVVDDHRLHLPDRPGNNRLDTFQNLITNPGIALLFMVPGREETLRVNGVARLLTDAALLEAHAMHGKSARAVVEITVRSVYFQCGKAVVRSGLWRKEKWPSLEGLAPFAEALSDQVRGRHPAISEAQLATAYRETLY